MKRLLPLIVISLMTLMWSLGTEAQTFTSNGTGGGDWDDGATWDQGGAIPGAGNNVIVLGTDQVTISGLKDCIDLQVDFGGSIIQSSISQLRFSGDLLVNGTISGMPILRSTKIGGIIDGSGSISITNAFIIEDTHTISAGADITVNGDVELDDPPFGFPVITNLGTLTVNGNITTSIGTETFRNGDNAILNISGTLATGGTFQANGTNNLVNYTSVGPVTVRQPSGSSYEGLEFSGGGTYTLPSAMTVNGGLTVTSGTFNTGNFDLTLNGDFTNNGTFTPGTSTITFSGTAGQSVALGGATSIDALVLNNTGGGVTVDNNIGVSNTLTMTAGNIDMSGNTLTLGTGTGNEGTLNFTSGRVIGSFERWIGSVGAFTFPIGVAANDRTVALDVVTLGAGGSVIASFIASSPGNAGMPFNDGVDITNSFPDGYWDLSTPNTFATTNYNLGLTGDGFRVSPGIDADTRLIVRADAGSNWVAEGNHENAVGTTVQRNTLPNFPRQYAFGDDEPCTPPVTSAISGNTEVCTGEASVAYSVVQPGTNTFSWSITGGTIDSGDGTNSILVTWGSTGQIGSLMVVENDGTCSGDPVSLDVTINSIAPTAISGETSVAENTTGYVYSVTNTTDYTYTWTITGGSLISGDGTNSIVVDWGGNGMGNVSVVAQRTGCDPAPAFDIDVTIFGTFIPDQDGDWDVGLTWVGDVAPGPTDNVRITNGFTVSTTQPETINNLIVDAGNILNITDDFTVNGNIEVDGQLNVTGINNDLNLAGGATSPVNTLRGTGTISIADGFITIQNAPKEIAAGTQLTLSNGGFDIGSGFSVTNNGEITIAGNLDGSASSTWINSTNARLSIGGSLMTTGILNVSATGNLVNYTSTSPVTIKAPDVGNYQDLEFSGGSTYTLPSALAIDGNLTVTSGTFNTGNFDLILNGDFTNNGTFTPGTSTITFSGSAGQSVALGGATSIDALVLNNTGGGVTVDNNIGVSNTLTMTAGNIDMSGNTLTLGTGTGNVGTLNFTAGRVIGSFERWIGSAGAFTFPIGVAANDRTVALDVVTLGAGGSVIASFIASSPGNAGMPFNDGVEITNSFPDGYWDLSTPNTFVTTNYNLDLTGDGFRVSPGIDADTRLIVRADAASNWVAEGNHENAVGTTVQRNTLPNFPRQYAFGDDEPCTPPVTLGIIGSIDVCTGSTEGYSIDTPTMGSTYEWTITGGTVSGTMSNTISGEDLDMISVDWGSTGQVGNITVVETNVCSGDPVSLDVSINSIAPTAISGETSVAENTTGYVYSVTNTTDYTYTWTITGGTLVSGDGTSSIVVDWGANGTGNVSVVAQRTGCDPAPAFDIDVTIFGTFIPDQNGDWDVGMTWVGDVAPGPTDNVRITNGFTVTTTQPETINNLIIDAGETLNVTDNFTVNGDTEVDGQLNITGTNHDLNLAGSATSPVNRLRGTGTISIADGFITIQNAPKEIAAGTQLTLSSGGIDIGNNLTVTNNGNISINGNLDGGNSGSSWINGANSRLTLNASVFPTNGSLSAGATGNTVEYVGTTNSDILIPSDFYYHLDINTSAIKTVTGNLDIDGDLILRNGSFSAGNMDYNIAIAGNWTDTGGDFIQAGSTVTFDGTGDQTITEIDLPNPSGLITFDNVVINKASGSLILDQANSTSIEIESAGSITFTNGILQTTDNESLTVESGATMNDGNANSYVDGPLIKIDAIPATFPVGNGNIWAPVTVNGSDGTTGGSRSDAITVQYFDAAFSDTENLGAGLNNVSTVEYWDIDVSSDRAYTADLTFFWKDQARSAITEPTDLRIAHYNGATWEEIPQSGINFGAQGDITVTGVTSFSPFTFGSGTDAENPLPVELLGFEARLIENQANLTWTTASEVNNDFFEVQRSEDGAEWEIVGTVDGNGTVNEVINYEFTDPRPLFGKSFYRLRQVDFDGQFEFSPVVSIDNPFGGEAMEVLVFPNPTEAGNINLRVLTGNKENKVTVQLIDALGHRFIDENMDPETFNQDLIISPRESLSRGVYFLIVTQNNKAIRQRLIIN